MPKIKKLRTARKPRPELVTGSFSLHFEDIIQNNRYLAIIFGGVAILLLASVIPIAVYRSLASTSVISLQAESGTRTANAVLGTDGNASGGSYVQFNAPAAGNYDFVVTAVTASPAAPTAGSAVTFSATVKNIGTGASPSGTQLGTGFWVDGVKTSWSDTFTSSLAAGQSTTLTSNSGPSGSATWTATSGTHSIDAFVDDINRFTNETNETNNHLIVSLNVGGSTSPPPPPPTGTIGETYGASAVFYLGSLPSNIRNGVYNDAKAENIHWIRADVNGTSGDIVWVDEVNNFAKANNYVLKAMPTIYRQNANNSVTIANALYNKGVRVLMLDNEANLSGQSLSNYITYFKAVYDQVHPAHPDLTILTTGLAQSGTVSTAQWTWLDGFGDAGILDRDNIGVGMHWYYDGYTPGTDPGTDWHFHGLTDYGLTHWLAEIDKYTAKKPKIWVTESGMSRYSAPDANPPCQYLGEDTQANHIAAAYQFNSSWLKSHRDRLGPMFIFALINKAQDGCKEENFGLWSYDSTHKYPAADALKNVLNQQLQ